MSSNMLVDIFSFLVVTCVVVVNGLNNIDYCQLSCKNGRETITHVVCEREPNNCGPHERCENHMELNITKSLQQFIVNEHNKYRNKVALGLERRGTEGPQPTASNMKEFRYNEELGRVAQCWANTCQIQKHSYCNRASNLPFVGQNMALRSYSWPGGVTNIEKNIKLMVAAWYDEVELFNNNYVPKFHFELSYGHYTQMIWGSSEEVGCGISLYTANGWYHIFLVCDYGSKVPSGNILNFEVYKIGKPCSQCPRGTVCNAKFKGLCSVPERPEPSKTPPTINNQKNANVISNYTKANNYLEITSPSSTSSARTTRISTSTIRTSTISSSEYLQFLKDFLGV